jgi:Ca2+-transporting ATPase
VTITLSIGMNELVKKNALIRNLRSVETLGSASVICSDKTGTLTRGVMTAVRLWYCGETYRITGAGYDPIVSTLLRALLFQFFFFRFVLHVI